MKHIIIIGEQGSGKTKKLNELLNLVPPDRRALTTQHEFQTRPEYLYRGIYTFGIINVYDFEGLLSRLNKHSGVQFIIEYQMPANKMPIFPDDDFEIVRCFKNNHIASDLLKIDFNLIRQWAKDKGILDGGNPLTQYAKLNEEVGELGKAILKSNDAEYKDAIGDIVVVLTSLAYFKGFTIEECINSAYEVISKRTGKMVNNNFVKNEE